MWKCTSFRAQCSSAKKGTITLYPPPPRHSFMHLQRITIGQPSSNYPCMKATSIATISTLWCFVISTVYFLTGAGARVEELHVVFKLWAHCKYTVQYNSYCSVLHHIFSYSLTYLVNFYSHCVLDWFFNKTRHYKSKLVQNNICTQRWEVFLPCTPSTFNDAFYLTLLISQAPQSTNVFFDLLDL